MKEESFSIRRREGRGGREDRREGGRSLRSSREGRGGEEGSKISVVFWNVAGLKNKDDDFWKGLEKWDVMVLLETWAENKDWGGLRNKFPRSHEWSIQGASKTHKKGRAKGGMVIGIRKDLVIKEKQEEDGEEGVMRREVRWGRNRLRVVGVYVNGDMEKKLEAIRGWMEEKKEGIKTVIGGDFNARTGREGGRGNGKEEDEEGNKRRSRDSKMNKEGEILLDFIKERGWFIMNGNTEGDERGEWTYTGARGESVIDYVLGDEELAEEVTRVEIGGKVDSDHHPIVVQLEGGEETRRAERRQSGRVNRGIWDEAGKERFRQKLERVKWNRDVVQETMSEMEEKIRNILRETGEEIRGVKKGGIGWWDEECAIKKKKLKWVLKKWRRDVLGGEAYRREKKEYKELCNRKKAEENERWEREVEKAETDGQIWQVVNKERKKRRGINWGIGMGEWEEYFKGLLGGVENKVVWGREGKG